MTGALEAGTAVLAMAVGIAVAGLVDLSVAVVVQRIPALLGRRQIGAGYGGGRGAASIEQPFVGFPVTVIVEVVAGGFLRSFRDLIAHAGAELPVLLTDADSRVADAHALGAGGAGITGLGHAPVAAAVGLVGLPVAVVVLVVAAYLTGVGVGQAVAVVAVPLLAAVYKIAVLVLVDAVGASVPVLTRVFGNYRGAVALAALLAAGTVVVAFTRLEANTRYAVVTVGALFGGRAG
jgi:hypothetical protein